MTRYEVKEAGFSKEGLRDAYLQTFSREEKCEGITGKTLSDYLNRWVTEILKDPENVLTQQDTSRSEAGVEEAAQVFSKKYKPVARKVKPDLAPLLKSSELKGVSLGIHWLICYYWTLIHLSSNQQDSTLLSARKSLTRHIVMASYGLRR